VNDFLKKNLFFPVFLWILNFNSAYADTVSIKLGEANFQGFSFAISSEECAVVTIAAEGLQVGQTVVITDDLEVSVMNVDASLGLALIGPLPYSVSSHYCNGGNSPMRSLKALLKNHEHFNVWLDYMPQDGWELGRTLIAHEVSYVGDKIVANSGVNQTEVSVSLLGSSVWLIATDESESAYVPSTSIKYWKRFLFGEFAGIVSRFDGNEVIIIPPEIIKEFVSQSIYPINLQEIELIMADGKLNRYQRGKFYWPGTSQSNGDFYVDGTPQVLSYEFDLGDRDTISRGLKISRKKNSNSSNAAFELLVYTSQYRPPPHFWVTRGNMANHWTETRCVFGEIDSQSQRSRTVTQFDLDGIDECQFENPRVIRGVRVSVSGDVNSLNGIELVTQNR